MPLKINYESFKTGLLTIITFRVIFQGQYHHLAQPTSTHSTNFKAPAPGVSQPITLSRTMVPTIHQSQPGNVIVDLSKKAPTQSSIDGQQVQPGFQFATMYEL